MPRMPASKVFACIVLPGICWGCSLARTARAIGGAAGEQARGEAATASLIAETAQICLARQGAVSNRKVA